MNRLHGTITGVACSDGITIVDVEVEGMTCSATLVGAEGVPPPWRPGVDAVMAFSETEVSLAKGLSGAISIRNVLPCTVMSVAWGKILCEVSLNLGGQAISSIITTRSAEELELSPGDFVSALIKANEMTLAPAQTVS